MPVNPYSSKGESPFSPWEKPYVLGVDGCPDGWIGVAIPASGPIDRVESIFHPSFAHLVNAQRAESVVIDMPIGLQNTGRRPCETMARKILKQRSSSVFPAPRRPMLSMASYEEANAWGKEQGIKNGGGLSKQTWMITPKIAEIDTIITPDLQRTVYEGHPEIAFTRLNQNAPCPNNKKTHDGQTERLNLLRDAGIPHPETLYEQGQQQGWHYQGDLVRIRVAKDDLIDAAALALTARAKINNDPSLIHLFDGTLDEKGLRIEILG